MVLSDHWASALGTGSGSSYPGTYIVISRLPRRRSNSRSELMLLKGGSRVPIPPPWGGHGDLDDCGSSRPENPRRENVARRVLDSCGDQRRRQLFLDRGLKGGRGVTTYN